MQCINCRRARRQIRVCVPTRRQIGAVDFLAIEPDDDLRLRHAETEMGDGRARGHDEWASEISCDEFVADLFLKQMICMTFPVCEIKQ